MVDWSRFQREIETDTTNIGVLVCSMSLQVALLQCNNVLLSSPVASPSRLMLEEKDRTAMEQEVTTTTYGSPDGGASLGAKTFHTTNELATRRQLSIKNRLMWMFHHISQPLMLEYWRITG